MPSQRLVDKRMGEILEQERPGDSEKIDSKRRFRMGEVMAKKIPHAEMPYRTLGSTKEQVSADGL